MKTYIYLLVILAIMVTALPAQENPETVMEDFYPDDTILFYALRSIAETQTKIKKLPIVHLFNDFKALNKEFRMEGAMVEALKQSGVDLQQLNEFSPEALGLDLEKLPIYFPGQCSAGIYLRERDLYEPSNLEWCLIIELGTYSDELKFSINSLFRRLRGLLGINDISTQDYPGYSVTSFRKGGQDVLNYAVYNNQFLIITRTKNEMIKTVYRVKERRSDILAETTQFRRVKRDFKEEADLFMYINAAGWGPVIANAVPGEVNGYLRYLEPTGLFNVRAIGGSMNLTETGVAERFILHMNRTEGVFGLLGNSSGITFDFTQIPYSAAQLQYVNLDLVQAGNGIAEMLLAYEDLAPELADFPETFTELLTEAEIESGVNFRDDIVANIEGSIVLFGLSVEEQLIENSNSVPFAALKIFEPDMTQRNLVNFFDKGLKLKLTEKKHDNEIIYYRQFNTPQTPYFAFVVIEDLMYVSTHPRALIHLLDSMKDGRTLASDTRFKAFSDDDLIKAFAYTDIQKSIKQFADRYQLKGTLTLSQLISRVSGTAMLEEMLPYARIPDMESIGSRLNVFSQKIIDVDGRTEYLYHSPVPVQLLLMGGAYGLMRMIPYLEQQNEAQRVAASREKLEDLAMNMELYSMEHGGRYPETLGELYPHYISSLSAFAPPGLDSELKFRDQISSEGMFVLRKKENLGNLGPDEIILYQKKGIHPSGFLILYRSGRIEFRPPNAFEGTLEEMYGNQIEIIE